MQFFLPELIYYTFFIFSLQTDAEKQGTNKGTPSLM